VRLDVPGGWRTSRPGSFGERAQNNRLCAHRKQHRLSLFTVQIGGDARFM